MPQEFTQDQIRNLSDEALDKAIVGEPTAPPTPPPATPPAAPPAEPPVVPAAAPTPIPAPAPVTPTPAPGDAPKLFAGKYKTEDDLAKGLVEIGKPLQIPLAALQKAVELAKTTGNWQAAEEMYVSLNEELERRKAEKAAPPPATTTPPVQPPQAIAPSIGAAEIERTIQQVVARETFKEVSSSPVVAELRRLGVDFPTTAEAWAQLKLDYPAHWMELKQHMERVYNENYREALAYQQALLEADPAFESERQSATAKIKEFYEKNGLEIDEASLKAQLDQLQTLGVETTNRNGVEFPVKDAYWRSFLLANVNDLLPKVKLASEVRGRIQHMEDLRRMSATTVGSISTTPAPGSSRVVSPTVNVDDTEAIHKLSDDALEEEIKKLSKK
jgi:hypothetical protein